MQSTNSTFALCRLTDDLAAEHIGVFELTDTDGFSRLEIQACDETRPDGFDDNSALLRTIELAAAGNRAALAALYLDGRRPDDDRCWFPVV